MKKRLIFTSVLLVLVAVVGGFAQVTQETVQEQDRRMNEIRDLYTKAEYAACKKAIENALADEEAGKLSFPFYVLAEIYVYKALVVYAFREEGFQKEIDGLLLKAVELDLNYDFKDYAQIPTYIIDRFIKIKREYHARFSKSTRRHCLGLYGVISYLPSFIATPEYLKPGIHYSLNLSDNFTLLLDFETPLSAEFFNYLQFRTGIIWFPSFKIETISMGLGINYSLRIENFSSFTNMIAIEGYGEWIFRFGLGIAASVELVRLDVLFGAGSFPTIGYIDVFTSDLVKFSFANLRIYLFFTF